MKEILFNIEGDSREIRYAFLKFGKLEDLIIERKESKQITGNIYRGKIINILNNIQSAFVNIGTTEKNENLNGFIHITDILENTKKFEEMFDMDFDLKYDISNYKKTKRQGDISKLLKLNQNVLVQVIKEPIGTKGARLTSNVSIAGRYLVLLPNTPHRGVSRKIEDKNARDSLKALIRSFKMPQNMGLICRTSSINATKNILIKEAHELLDRWQTIVKKFHSSKRTSCLYEESDIIKRSILTAIEKKANKVVIDNYKAYKYAKQVYQSYKSEHLVKIEFYKGPAIFEKFGIEREIDKALKRKIWLNCGGYLYFDRTEAMHTIDVNSGKSLQNENLKGLEETLVRINLEAVEEIARQLRLRNIGGLIICDFIDMKFKKNQRRVLEKLKDCIKEDFAKCMILGMSELGLIEMTRQRIRESLEQTILTKCQYCDGLSMIKSFESTYIDILRSIRKIIAQKKEKNLILTVHPEVLNYIDKNPFLLRFVKYCKASLEFKKKDTLHLNQYIFTSKKTNQSIDL